MSSADLVASRVDAPASRLVVERHPGSLRRQVLNEIHLVFRRRRNLALLVLLAAVPVLIGTAVKVSAPDGDEGPPFLNQVSGNGLFLAFTALTVCLPVFLPLGVGIVSGDALANESSLGTMRYLLTVPISRTRLLVVKTFGVLAFAAAAVLTIALTGVVVGAMLFGLNEVTLLSGDTVSLSSGVLRGLGIAAYVFVSLLGLIGVGLFFSTLTEVPVGAMGATVAFAVTSTVLDAVPQLGSSRQFLLTHDWLDFGGFLSSQVPTSDLLSGLVVPLCYAAIAGAAAWARFTSADITA